MGFLIVMGIRYWVGEREWWTEKEESVGQRVGKSQLVESVEGLAVSDILHLISPCLTLTGFICYCVLS